MKAMRQGFALLLLLSCVAAGAAPPQLVVPHGRAGQAGTAGASAIWRGNAGGPFVIEASGDIAQAAGNLQRRALSSSADGTISFGTKHVWDAAALLDQGGPRKLFTTGQQGTTIPFDWGSLPPEARALLDQPTPDAAPDGLGELRVAFLRGDRSREDGQPQALFRKRASLLGDIVNSTPLIVGAPQPVLAASGHAAFRAQYKGRALTVYAGANDGMLHAFSAATGSELFAYFPTALMRHLPALASPAYKSRPYVDGSAGFGDAVIGANWRTVLASGMGMGARGVFALDITDPENAGNGVDAPLALWEFTEADDGTMGHVREPPLIANIRVGKGGKGGKDASPDYFAVVSSGINNLAPDGSGALFLLSLGKSGAHKWKKGENYFSIKATGVAGDAAATPNALSAPALVIGQDGSASRAYAGDLHGNLWRFDFNTMKAHRLFTARAADGAHQPISHAPRVVYAPGGGYLVLFATGKLIEAVDLLPSSFSQQSVYAILDRPEAGVDAVLSRSQLAARTLAVSSAGYTIKGDSFAFTGSDKKMGWYFDLPNSSEAGERAAGSLASIAEAVVITSLLPKAGTEGALKSRLYVVDALTGFAHAPSSGAKSNGVTGELTLIDPTLPLHLLDVGLDKGDRNATGGVAMTRRVTLVSPKGGADAPAAKVEVHYQSGRLGWREVANWKELHDAATQGK